MLERVRRLAEDREMLEVKAAGHLLHDTRSQEKRVLHQHGAAAAIEELLQKNKELAELMVAETLLKDLELGTGQESFTAFYGRLRELKEYHERHPGIHISREPGLVEIADENLPRDVVFSGPERHGRHLDLHEFYDTFLNLKRSRRKREQNPALVMSYREYCGSFFEFDADEEGKDDEYRHYLQDLLAYLVDFLKRAQPLLDVASLMARIDLESSEQFDNGTFRSWGGEASTSSDPLYCEACETRFSKETTFQSHLQGKKHKRNMQKPSLSRRETFLLEVKINRLSDSLADVLQATIADIEKKQSRTLREQLDAMEAESDDEEGDGQNGDPDDDGDDQGFAKQIKNYPTGWDGEPIPYWLYRLHGLGVAYACEICGGTTYWGRRAFEKHFEEFRHTNSLRLLGLNPSEPAFFDVVRIKDVLDLNKKLEADRAKAWKPDEEVEMEDDQGRVYPKKMFDMLVKQGVIRPKK